MANITISISKSALITSVESLLWKYGKTIEGADNYKQVYNTHSEHGANNVDNKVLTDSFITRGKEAIEVLREFISGNVNYATDGSPTVTLAMPTRWASKQELLQNDVDKYVLDGMMVDWLQVTAPSEAALYATKLPQDEIDIRVELYAKGTPV